MSRDLEVHVNRYLHEPFFFGGGRGGDLVLIFCFLFVFCWLCCLVAMDGWFIYGA